MASVFARAPLASRFAAGRSVARVLGLLVVAVWVVQSPPVQAEAGDAPMQRSAEPGRTAVEDWKAQNPWRYDSGYLFGLSRGLNEEGLHGAARIACLVFTLPLDLAYLPGAAVAGLFGR